MSHDLPPTSRAFAGAVHHDCQLGDLSLDELAYLLAQLGLALAEGRFEELRSRA